MQETLERQTAPEASSAPAVGPSGRTLAEVTDRVRWLSHWMIHHANHIRRKNEGDVKVGGHQASSASIAQIMTSLYLTALRPQDRVAVKPHASPIFHALQYLAGNIDRERLEAFRGFGGAQSYPSRTKDMDDVDFSTGSVGLGVGITVFGSLIQDYLDAREKMRPEGGNGRMVALVGDAELDEGNVYEALQEGWKHDLRNCWWIVDYNRQSLDGVVSEGLWERIEAVFRAFGWRVVRLRYGRLQEEAFREPGGSKLRDWIEACPNSLFSALTYQARQDGGAAWRKRLAGAFEGDNEIAALLDKRSDRELSDLMGTLGGHCLDTLSDAFAEAATAGDGGDARPVVFLAYTVKGWGSPLAGHKDNHGGLMTEAQFAEWKAEMKIKEGEEWERPAGLVEAVRSAPFFSGGRRRHSAPVVPVGPAIEIGERTISTQSAFGKILDEIARRKDELSDHILTLSPDVTVSTNLGPWVNRRGIFARADVADTFREERVPSAQKWGSTPAGQHLELGIAEMNLFLALGAAGLSHSLFGRRLLPVGTLYDPFISRGLDALNYACYQDARFIVAGTPSGVSLAPEGGAHQSIATPLIGISQAGLTSFEPAYADELSAIMAWAFEHMQAEDDADEPGGSVYLRLSTRPLEQPVRKVDETFREEVISGAYWWRRPGPNTELVIAAQGAVMDQAIAAAGRLGERARDVAVLAVTSADRLQAGWTQAFEAARGGSGQSRSRVEDLFAGVPRHASLVTVLDGHPATLSWLGGVRGHRTAALGVDRFGQTGTIAELYRYYGIDADGIVRAANRLLPQMRA